MKILAIAFLFLFVSLSSTSFLEEKLGNTATCAKPGEDCSKTQCCQGFNCEAEWPESGVIYICEAATLETPLKDSGCAEMGEVCIGRGCCEGTCSCFSATEVNGLLCTCR